MRLDKFICKSTALTKAQAVERLLNNQVAVNKAIVSDAAFQVHENNHVTLDGQLLVCRPFRYLLMNKPANTICSNVDEVYPSVLNRLTDLDNEAGSCDVNESGIDTPDIDITEIDTTDTPKIFETTELHIAGRLDADTTGLILITDDGRWTFNITLPTNDCKKVYRVGLSKPLQAHLIEQFNQGIQLQGEAKLTLPATLVQLAEKEVLLTITEGKFHQVKRMFAAVGNRVIKLHREQIGDVKLDVELGKWRYLTPLEVASFV
ncbi:pseudouridine synthase [Psychromonas sp. SP041]|uniref:pseudouridine synthase n=1 Tax=Psychromonas sp. SP041 TaxID=1365007 RepID=UPI00040C41E0|nr:pseudouridine synthase [Psychromonas sp. SP041]